jgi:hypothetical protein
MGIRTSTQVSCRVGRLLGVLLILSTHACSHTISAPVGTPKSSESVPLRIDNHNWLDVVIYVVHDGQRTRLGLATATNSATFSLPMHLLGQGREVRFLADPVGGHGTVSTETIVVQPGQSITWTLETDLRRSFVAVF